MEDSLRGSPLPRPPKRTHSQMSGIGTNNNAFTYQATGAERSEARRQSVAVAPPSRTSRYTGPGFDYRSPVIPWRAPSGSSNPHDVNEDAEPTEIVDLTNSEDAEGTLTPRSPFGQATRGPRFSRNIIDLSEETSSSHSSSSMTSNSDVQFVAERRLPTPHPATASSGPSSNVMDLTEDDLYIDGDSDDEVRFIRAAPRYPHSSPAPPSFGVSSLLAGGGSGSSSNALLQVANSISNHARRLAGLTSNNNSSHQRNAPAAPRSPPLLQPHHFLPSSVHNGGGTWGSGIPSFVAPTFDFDAVGFDLGLNDTPVLIPPPSITPPNPAPDGYTRSPKTDEVYVCPNCDRELRTGETELQRQIWVIRACGHVYCGECANHRSVAKQRKEKKPVKTKPFSHCVEEGCDRRTVSKHSMIQIFL